ncbi:MAG: hypothetical protein MZW92_38185 [Comamonadaceae bacterium]|nr:hypothetical protein [Comamonadaceae bacterium]
MLADIDEAEAEISRAQRRRQRTAAGERPGDLRHPPSGAAVGRVSRRAIPRSRSM